MGECISKNTRALRCVRTGLGSGDAVHVDRSCKGAGCDPGRRRRRYGGSGGIWDDCRRHADRLWASQIGLSKDVNAV